MDIEVDRVGEKAGAPHEDSPVTGGARQKGGEGLLTGIFRTLHMAFFVTAVFAITFLAGALIFPSVIFSRGFARKVGRTWNRMVLLLGGVKLKVCGLEKINGQERYVFMSNHQSALDIPIIYAGISENICFIAKKELFKIPVFGWCMSAMGHVSIDRENARKAHASMIRAVQKLNRENVSLILFPEGTRSKNGKVLEFKTASFTLALQAGVKLVPVAIKGAIDRLPPKSSKIVPGSVILEIGDPVDVETLQGMNKGDICNRVYKEIRRMVEGDAGPDQ